MSLSHGSPQELCQVHIDPYTNRYMINVIDLSAHLCQDSDELLSFNDNIIWYLIFTSGFPQESPQSMIPSATLNAITSVSIGA